MKISVIIPVYNAEKFLARAIESVLIQNEVDEVILVEDASPDNAIQICRNYEGKNAKVKLFQHPGGVNRGAGASRNLGIAKAQNEWIAFLDADDYYLPDRFKNTVETIKNHKDADGVYEAVQNVFLNEKQKQKFIKGRPKKFRSDDFKLLTFHLYNEIKPEELFTVLIKGDNGFIHLNGLCVKKSLIEACGMFDPQFRIMQDTYLIYKLSLAGNLYNGGLENLVAKRLVHESNRITQVKKKEMLMSKIVMFKSLLIWAQNSNVSLNKLNDINWKIGISEKQLGYPSLKMLVYKVIRKIKFSL